MGAGASTEALPASLKADDAKAFLGDKFDEAKFAELAGDSGEVAKEAFLAEVAKATPAEGVTEVGFKESRIQRENSMNLPIFCLDLFFEPSTSG